MAKASANSIVARDRLRDIEARKSFMESDEKLDELELEETVANDEFEVELGDAEKAGSKNSYKNKNQAVEEKEEKIVKPHSHSPEAHRDSSYMTSMHTYFYLKKKEREEVEKEADFGPEVERKSKESAAAEQKMSKESRDSTQLLSKASTQSIRQTQAKVKK